MGITKKQKEVYDYIAHYTHEYGYAPTQKEIRDHFGLKSFGSVQRYIKYLVDAGYLENDENARRGLVVLAPPTPFAGMTANAAAPSSLQGEDIPLLGKVAAGNPIEAIENPDDTITVPLQMLSPNYRHFALRVQGDSMIEDGILENDIVVCRSQNTALPGQTVVAVVEGEATVKRFYKKAGHYELHPANSTMSPIIVRPQDGEFKVVGILVGLLRSYL